MRLSVDILQSAPQVVNPLQQRELDLRGRGLTLLDDGPLALLGDSFDAINLTSNPLSSLQYFPFHAVSVAATPATPALNGQDPTQRQEVESNQYNPANTHHKGKWFDDISDDENEGKNADEDAANNAVAPFGTPASSLAATAVALATGGASVQHSTSQNIGAANGSPNLLVSARAPLMQRLTTLICHRCNLSFVSPSTCVRALPNITAFLADDNAFDHPRQLIFLRGWKQLEIVSFENNKVMVNAYSLLQNAREGETDTKVVTYAEEEAEGDVGSEAHQSDDEQNGDENADTVRGAKGVKSTARAKNSQRTKTQSTVELSAAEKTARAVRYFRMLIIYLCPTLKLINYERVTVDELQGASKLRKKFAKDIRVWETGSSAAASAVSAPDGVRIRKRGRHAIAAESSPKSDAAERTNAKEIEVASKKKRPAKDSNGGEGKSTLEVSAGGSSESAKGKAKSASSNHEEKDVATRMAELMERTAAAETEEELLALQVEIDALQEAAASEGKSKK